MGGARTAITLEATGICPTIYLDALKGEKDEEKVEEIIKIHENNKNPQIEIPDFKSIKPKLRYCVYSKQYERENTTAVCIPFMDICVVVKIMISGCANVTVTKQMLDLWGLSEIDLIAAVPKEEYVTKDMAELLPPEAVSELGILESDFMWVITTKDEIFGASCLYYPSAIAQLAEKLNSDLYIMPSSIHECICVKAEGEVTDLLTIVKEVNSEVLMPDDKLSDSVYRYSREDKKITIA